MTRALVARRQQLVALARLAAAAAARAWLSTRLPRVVAKVPTQLLQQQRQQQATASQPSPRITAAGSSGRLRR
jgi:hypothetical protein